MNLQQQLDELRNNILRDTSTIFAGTADKRWTDDTLLNYIADAERRFARRTLTLRDADTPSVVQLVMIEGQARYLLHPSVLAVVSAKYDDDTMDMGRIGRSLVTKVLPIDLPFFDPETITSMAPGRPKVFATDELLTYDKKARVALNVYPTPRAAEEGDILYMRVCRLPLSTYTTAALEVESEIPEDYQLDVLEWAAYRALRNQDSDAGDMVSADKHRERFDQMVAEVKEEARRKMFAPLQWDFGASHSYVR